MARTARHLIDQFRKLNALQMKSLKYIGLWMLDSDSPALLRCLYHVYNKLIIAIMLVFTVTLFADICLSLNDISIVADDGCIFAGIFVVLSKVLIFQARREQITRLFRATVQNCDQLCEFTTGSEYEILSKYLLLCRASLCGFSMLAFFLVVALLFLVSVEGNGALPIRAWYPFDTSAQPWHGVGFFVEACSVSVGLVAIVGMDAMQLSICVLFFVQFQILREHFEHSNGDGRADGRDFAERFARSVRHHQRLLVAVDLFNDVFSWGMFVQMLSSTVIICLTGFQATAVTDRSSNTSVKFVVYLSSAVTQLFYTCWVGNEVMHQSALLTQSQWFSGWDGELSNTGTRCLLMLPMIFSSRTSSLKAGVFYVLSMETFTTIMRGSYSFFAVLNTKHSDGDQ